ncbi:MAG: DUF4139 domain-containing protein [Myxococcota bacterium]
MTLVPSRLEAVKIYHSGATIQRVVEWRPEAGSWPREIEIAPLPLALVDSTVRLRVESVDAPGAELEAHELRVGLYAPPRELVVEPPEEKELLEVERALRLKREMLDHVVMEMDMLGAIPVPERPHGEEGKPPPPSPMAARVALEQFTEQAVDKRTAERKALRAEIDVLEKQAAELRDRQTRASSARQVSAQEISKTVIARLHHHGAPFQSARLVLEYFIPGARWAPAYQVRLTRDCQQAEVQLRALICQRSGEDWKGVKVTLSTAAPMRWTEIPELASVRVGRAQPAPSRKTGFRAPPQGAGALFQDFDRDRELLLHTLPRRATWSLRAADGMERERHGAFGGVTQVAMAPPPPPPPPPRSPAPTKAAMMKTAALDMRAEQARDVGEAAVDDEFTALAEPSYDAFEEDTTPPQGAPVAKPAPAPAAARAPVARARGGGPGAPPPQAPQSLDDFTLLRLSNPDDASGRARLRALDSRTAYLETLERAKGEIVVDVATLVNSAQELAAQIAALPLPRGAVNVRSAAGEAFDFAYHADGVVDVPSDGVFHSVALGNRTAEAQVQYVVVPREDSNVYRVSVIKNPTDAPLLSGPAEIYVGGEYVLTTNLPTVRPRGQITLGLGVEQAIKCARNTQFREARSGSKVVAMTELWHDITIQIVNGLERNIDCEVRERIPQPAKGAEVVVEEGEVSPAWSTYPQVERGAPLEGGRRWMIMVPARGEKTLKAQYVVKIYANNEIVGGNRREA